MVGDADAQSRSGVLFSRGTFATLALIMAIAFFSSKKQQQVREQ